MSNISRRKFVTTGLAVAAGAAGIAVAAKVARPHGLIPPDAGGLYGPGETLTYAAQRLLTRHSLAREFSRAEISKDPFANEVDPLGDEFKRLQAASFVDWRVTVDGMAARPASFSLAEMGNFPTTTQITMIGCEEGWTYIADWTGCRSLTYWTVLARSPKCATLYTARFNRTGGRVLTWRTRCTRRRFSPLA